MKRVTILGGGGFVGSHLLNQLSARGVRARVLSRNPATAGSARVAPGCEFRPCDVLDSSALSEQLARSDALINLIGILNESGRDGRGFDRAHVQVMASAIAACEQTGVKRIIQISALNAGQGTSHYLRSKGEAEALLEASALDWTILQPSVMFGPGDQFINRFATMLKIIPLWLPLACPDSVMQPIFVGDVSRAICRSLNDPSSIGQRYQLAGPKRYTLHQLVSYTRDELGLKRWIPGLPRMLSRLQAGLMGMVPGKPFSGDNYRSLQLDNVATEDGLARLGIPATALEAVTPGYLGAGTRAQRYQRLRRGAGRP